MIPALLASLLVATPTPPAPDPCGLVSSAEIAAVLAAKPSPGTRTEPVRDEESKADVTSCSHTLGEMFLEIGIAAFADPAAAAAAVKVMETRSQEVEEGIRMSPAPGLGDGSLWGANADGAIWVVRKGKYLLNVTLAGQAGDGAKYREQLKRLASSALGRL